MKCMVTGGAGFIGSHLVHKLLELGHSVVVIDNFSTGKDENLGSRNQNLSIYRRSVTDNLTDIFFSEKPDVVFHLAAIPSVQFSIENPVATHETNVDGTLNLLNCCKKFGTKRFIFSSSSAIYGNSEILPLKENEKSCPLSPYALHKSISESYCKIFYELYGLECICLRYFNVYGPKQDPEGEYASVIPKFISLVNKGIAPTINGDGNQTRDFVNVEDVIEANILSSTTENKDAFGQVFNIGSGQNININELADKIIEFCGQNLTPQHGQAFTEVKDSLADIEKAKTVLGWSPKKEFHEGLKETYDYFCN